MRLTPLVLIPLVADLTFLFLHAISRVGGFWKKRMEDSDVVGAFQRLTSAAEELVNRATRGKIRNSSVPARDFPRYCQSMSVLEEYRNESDIQSWP